MTLHCRCSVQFSTLVSRSERVWMYVCAIWRVSYLDSWLSSLLAGITARRRSNATFKPSILLLSRALAASRRRRRSSMLMSASEVDCRFRGALGHLWSSNFVLCGVHPDQWSSDSESGENVKTSPSLPEALNGVKGVHGGVSASDRFLFITAWTSSVILILNLLDSISDSRVMFNIFCPDGTISSVLARSLKL